MTKQEFERIYEKLSERKKETVELFLLGKTNPEIADSLHISQSTVRQYFSQIYQNFGLQDGINTSKQGDLKALILRYRPIFQSKAKEDINPFLSIQNKIIFWDSLTLRFKTFTKNPWQPETIRIQGLLSKPISHSIRDKIQIILQSLLCSQCQDGYWEFETNGTQFDRIYATTSVLYFLFQCGLNQNHRAVSKALSYLETIDLICIDNRAKSIFGIITQTTKIEEQIVFLNVLRKEQKKYEMDDLQKGSFLFIQESQTKNKQWKKIHDGENFFHSLHIADTLFHTPSNNQEARKIALEILLGICLYFDNFSRTTLFLNLCSQNPRLIIWYFHIACLLGLDLPNDWNQILSKVIKKEQEKLLDECFMFINIAQFTALYSQKIGQNTLDQISCFAFKVVEFKIKSFKICPPKIISKENNNRNYKMV